jgi:hypothetical protein
MLMMFAVRRVSELDGTGDFGNRRDPDRDQKIAETFNDSRFSEFLANSDFADHDRMLRDGLALLLGVDPEQVVGQESSSTGEVDVLSLLELASEAAALTRQLSPDASDEDNDDRLFPLTKDEMHEHLATFLRNATGEDVDVEAFIRQMRVNGGIHGVPRVDWYNLLHFLGWDLTEFNESGPKRFTPAFWASTRDGGIELPVIVEGYMYSPGDEEDELAREAFLTLPKRYPKGCILVFGSMLYKVVDKRCYTFGGMLFRNGQWRPFALSQSVVSLDDLLLQHEKVFSFGTPGRDYEDVDGKLARKFNAMAAGWDVETDPQPPMMALDLHGWVCPMLRTITLPKSR